MAPHRVTRDRLASRSKRGAVRSGAPCPARGEKCFDPPLFSTPCEVLRVTLGEKCFDPPVTDGERSRHGSRAAAASRAVVFPRGRCLLWFLFLALVFVSSSSLLQFAQTVVKQERTAHASVPARGWRGGRRALAAAPRRRTRREMGVNRVLDAVQGSATLFVLPSGSPSPPFPGPRGR